MQSYLEGNGGANATDAALFGFVAPGATLEEARAVMRETRSADVFVTLTGQKSEGALGWLTDDLLEERLSGGASSRPIFRGGPLDRLPRPSNLCEC